MYVTDALSAIAENTSRLAGGHTMRGRYADMLNLNRGVEEERSADEIISSIRKKLGGECV